MTNKILNLSIAHKLWAIVLVGIIGMAIAVTYASHSTRRHLLQDRMVKTRDLVESAQNVVEHYYSLAQAGELSEAEAKTAAMEAVKSMRYGDKGYFWINDFTPRVLMHPLKPNIIGKDMGHVTDGVGKYHWRAFVDVVRRDGGGVVEYLFLHKAKGVITPKISYVKGFEPWGWIVGTGIFVDDVDAIFHQQLIRQSLVVAGTLFFMLLVSFWVGRTIIRPVTRLSRVIQGVQADGTLSERTGLRHGDEVGSTGQAFDDMLGQLEKFVLESQSVSQQLFAKAKQLACIVRKTNQGMDGQLQETQQAATAMTEMVASAGEVARNATNAATVTAEARQKGEKGGEKLQRATQTMQTMSGQMGNVATLVKHLESETDRIGKVLDVIRGIAEQTNLLALNAAIEAARAGEKGRGFAVVADEVRTLAQRTQTSTSEIDEMISNLQGATSNLVSAMNEGLDITQQGLVHANAADESLRDILQAILGIDDMNTQIATAAEEQSAVSAEINQHILSINNNVEAIVSTTAELNEVSEATQEAATRMQQVAGRYRV